MRKEDGNDRSDRDAEGPKRQGEEGRGDPAELLFYEEYVDQAALDFHGGTSYFKDLGKNLSGLLDGAPKELFYEAVAAIAR